MNLIAKTFHGTEDVLAAELEQLGVKNIKKLRRAVSFDANREELYKANLYLRTAVRILAPFHQFTAGNEDELYKKIMAFNWSSILGPEQTLAIDASVFSTHFTHSKYVALKTKDAIVDQFRNTTGKRPSIELKDPDIRLNIHVEEDRFILATDSSGQSLHKRGYRPANVPAPLNEALAASMILMSGWTADLPFIDPMCGSGTLSIEAAMIACNIPPGLSREKFGFMGWKNFDRETWNKVVQEAKEKIITPNVSIQASDVSSGAINLSREAARNAGVISHIRFQKTDFKDLIPKANRGVMILNPPYGERLTEEDIAGLYTEIGDKLKKDFHGFDAWLISSNMDALKNIGLHPSKTHTLYNGPLKCKYQKFSIYEGSKKEKYSSPEEKDQK